MMRRLVCLATLALLAACSGTTWRHDTTRTVSIDGRDLTVSWIRLQEGELDVVVSDADGSSPLPAATAIRAAQVLADAEGGGDHGCVMGSRYGAVAQARYALRCSAAR